MAYGDNSQYATPQMPSGDLSAIIEAALKRRQMQQQQSQLLGSSLGSIMSKLKLNQIGGGPTVDNSSSGDYGLSSYGAQNYAGGGVADDMQGREREGGAMSPEEMDILYRAAQAQAEHRRQQVMNEAQMPAQHYARGGVATENWSDPYAVSQQYTPQLGHLADVSGIGAAIMRNHLLQNEFNQQQMQDAYNQSTKLMERQRSDDAANAAMYGMQYPNDPYGGFTNPDRVPDYGGVNALASDKTMQAQALNTEKINAQRALEYDRYMRGQGGGGAAANGREVIYDANGNPHTVTGNVAFRAAQQSGQQTSPDDRTQFDQYGREWRQTANGGWTLVPKGQAITTDQLPQMPDQIITPDQSQGTGLPNPQAAQPQQPLPQTGNPPAVTGIAASYEEAQIGQHFRAPDGSIRLKQN